MLDAVFCSRIMPPASGDLKCKKRIKGKIRLGERWVRGCNMWDRVGVGGMVVKAD